MAYVYILYSNSINKYYTGSCKNLAARLIEHNSHKFKNSFTANAYDWEVFLAIENLAYKQSRRIENHIKKMKSKTYIQNLKKYPEMIDKLKIKYVDTGSFR